MFDCSPAREEAAEDLEGLEVRESYNTGEYLGASFNEDNDALREAANEIIQEMKTDGTHRRGLPGVVRHQAAQGSAREDEHAQVVRRPRRTS